MAFVDVVFKTTAGALGLATLVLGADMVYAMSKEAIVGKAPVSRPNTSVSHDVELLSACL